MAKARRSRRPGTSRGPARPRNPDPPAPRAGTAKAGTGEAGTDDPALTRADALVATASAVGALALFVWTFSGHVALGDAPESVAGIRSLGILHAPGYPSYVLAARLFSTVFPVGGWAFRANAFSVACSTASVVVVYLLARCLGASRVGAVVGALALATSASFWFNAGFAKHYAFTGLLVILGALLAVLWQRSGRTSLLVLAGAVLGLGAGAGWQLALIMLVSVGAMLALGPRRPGLAALVGSGAAVVVAALALWAFVLVRANQSPAVNWGDATTVSRLMSLVLQKDFGFGQARPNIWNGTTVALGGLARDLGLGAVGLALIGAVLGFFGRLRRDRTALLAIAFVANTVAVGAFSGFNYLQGFLTSIIGGGYLIVALMAAALLAALGATYLIDGIATRVGGSAAVLRVLVAAVLVMVAVAPSVVFHHRYADFRHAPIADDYATRMLAAVPRHGVLLTFGAEFAFPMQYRQVVFHERPDVTVITLDSLGLEWARARLARRYHLGNQLEQLEPAERIQVLINRLRQSHPVVLDTTAMQALADTIGYRSRGLVGELTDGTGPQPTPNVDALAKQLQRADAVDGLVPELSNRMPERTVYYFHERAHIELAKVYAAQGRLPAARRELRRALRIFPSDAQLRKLIVSLGRPGVDVAARIRDA